MRASHWWATGVASLVGGLSLVAWAQNGFPPTGGVRPGAVPAGRAPLAQPSAAPAAATTAPRGTNVAVVDLKRVIDNHIRLKAAMDEIKKESEAFQASVKEEEAKLRQQIEQLKGMAAGTAEYKQLETEIATRRTQVQLDINRRQKAQVEEEARVLFNVNQEIEGEIRKFAQQYGVDLVLQHSSLEMDPAKPDTVLRGLNRLVLYQDRLDITDAILQELNRGAPTANTGAPPPANAATRPQTQRIGSPQGTPGFPSRTNR